MYLRPRTRTPFPGGHNTYFSCHFCFIIRLSDLCPEIEIIIFFLKYNSSTLFQETYSNSRRSVGNMKSPNPSYTVYQKFGKNWPSSSCLSGEMLTDNAQVSYKSYSIPQSCSGVTNKTVLQPSKRSIHGFVLCQECCHGDLCNADGCGAPSKIVFQFF